MKLTTFTVRMYKGVIDSGPIAVEPLTVIVGKNESGKTTLLKALHKLNPATPEPYTIETEWPRGHRRERRKDHTVCSATFLLDENEIAELGKLTDRQDPFSTVEVSRNYEGQIEVTFPSDLFPEKLHPNDVDRQCEKLPQLTPAVGAAYLEQASKCRAEAIRAAHEGRFSELKTLQAQHASALTPTPGPDAEKVAQQQYHAAYMSGLQQLAQQLSSIPSIRQQAHEFVVQRLPKFIYMSDYRTFRGKALLDQVKQRRDKKRLETDDETFLMILTLSGLDLDELVAKGNTSDRDHRQFDIDDGGKTLTRTFKDRLKQREYQVEFRADGQEFYTMVTDNQNGSLIKLEERSKGFQWFFSFDLLFMHESGGTFENCVLLLDEPGLHLHPGAQKDLLARLDEYARGNTLIYSTHLPFMLDLRHPERMRVINDSAEGTTITDDLTQAKPEGKLTLEAALGMSGSQSYLVAHRNIVVEGADDYMLITELSNLLIRSGEEGLPEDVLITASGGASEAAYIGTFMIGQQLNVAVLLDSDRAGEIARDKLVKKWLTRYKGTPSQVLRLNEAVGAEATDFSIEDLFTDDFYLRYVQQAYGCSGLELVGTGQLCKRVEKALAKHNIKFNKGAVAKLIRGDLRRMKDVAELPSQTKAYATRLMKSLVAALPSATTNGPAD